MTFSLNEPRWIELLTGEQADGSWVLDDREFFQSVYPESPRRDGPKDEGALTEKPLLSTKESMEDTAEWWRENMPPRYKGLLDATLKEKEADDA